MESALVDAVAAAGGLCLKFVSPGHAGVPDRIILLNGAVHFVEVKRPNETLRKLQTRCADLLRRHGASVGMVSTVDGAREYVSKISL